MGHEPSYILVKIDINYIEDTRTYLNIRYLETPVGLGRERKYALYDSPRDQNNVTESTVYSRLISPDIIIINEFHENCYAPTCE